jgi:putative copper resistance protein D
MAISIGYSSHAASLKPLGLLPHTLHFLAVTIWSGILLIVGFFSNEKKSLLPFYRWFTPLAFACLLTVIGAGLWLMNYIVPEYVNSYMLNYGQALLVKHILLFVIVCYSVINGVWIKRKLQAGSGPIEVLKWIKIEAVFLFLVFVATAVMSQQTPPHDVAETVKMEHPSKLFTFITGLIPGNHPELYFAITMASIGWGIAALLFFAAAVLGIKKNASIVLVAVSSILAAGALYLGVMASVTL